MRVRTIILCQKREREKRKKEWTELLQKLKKSNRDKREKLRKAKNAQQHIAGFIAFHHSFYPIYTETDFNSNDRDSQ